MTSMSPQAPNTAHTSARVPLGLPHRWQVIAGGAAATVALAFCACWRATGEFGGGGLCAMFAGFSVGLIVLFMVVVQTIQPFRSARPLGDVIAVLIWSLLIAAHVQMLTTVWNIENLLYPLLLVPLLIGGLIITGTLGVLVRIWMLIRSKMNDSTHSP